MIDPNDEQLQQPQEPQGDEDEARDEDAEDEAEKESWANLIEEARSQMVNE